MLAWVEGLCDSAEFLNAPSNPIQGIKGVENPWFRAELRHASQDELSGVRRVLAGTDGVDERCRVE